MLLPNKETISLQVTRFKEHLQKSLQVYLSTGTFISQTTTDDSKDKLIGSKVNTSTSEYTTY